MLLCRCWRHHRQWRVRCFNVIIDDLRFYAAGQDVQGEDVDRQTEAGRTGGEATARRQCRSDQHCNYAETDSYCWVVTKSASKCQWSGTVVFTLFPPFLSCLCSLGNWNCLCQFCGTRWDQISHVHWGSTLITWRWRFIMWLRCHRNQHNNKCDCNKTNGNKWNLCIFQ